MSSDRLRRLISTLIMIRMPDSSHLWFPQSLELMISDVDIDVNFISPQKSLLPIILYAGDHFFTSSIYSVNPMDPRLAAPITSLPLEQTKSKLPEALIPGGLIDQHPQTSPIPQAEWSNIPQARRPQSYPNPPEQLEFLPSDKPHTWHLRPQISGHTLSRANPPKYLHHCRRPNALEDLRDTQNFTTEEQIVDLTLLYPQLSPYESSASVKSATDVLEHIPRSVSPPSTRGVHLHPLQIGEPGPTHQLVRSPTYPPAGDQRMYNVTGVGDEAFADEEEFRLFVQATVGLDPEQAFKFSHSQPSSSSSDRTRFKSEEINHRGHSHPNVDRSPTEVTLSPSTARALQEVAQMPGTARQPLRRSVTSVPHHSGRIHNFSRLPTRQRLQTSVSGLDLWLEPPSTTTATSSLESIEDLNNSSSTEDELPDYASSQAQAQAAQRVEATRRAQELRRRWQASEWSRG
ncbi:hypothetical protein M433DRAFT_136724 [Acidomyces richmondensis BFW]|nr:MAG: hypothetical protein FE78DRAFT_510118 [Acidomyces sp. 'richmondensis']KYG43085.1 hypothetical protein M433DRAFT_136724 [Acidomyces richmondensis BFW]